MSERDIARLLALVRKHLGREWLDLANWTLEQNPIHEIEARVARGEYVNAISNVEDAAKKFAAEIQESYVTSGQAAAKWLDGKVADKLVRFDTLDSHVLARAKANELDLVTGFREEQYKIAQQVTQRAMIEGAGSGINPRRVAQDFRDSISLTPSQAEHVANYRRQLEQGEYLAATRRKLSSGQADRTLRRLDRDGDRLTPAQIDDYVERYRGNYVGHRATTIARTEALANANGGVRDAMNQAVARGDVERSALKKQWHSRGGPRGREDHAKMDDVEVPFDEDFELPDGTRMSGPGDPRGGAENNTNCGCTQSFSLA